MAISVIGAGEIEDAEVLAVTVGVEVAIGVLEGDPLRIAVLELFSAGKCLAEGCRILERETAATQAFSRLHPVLTAGAAMSLVDEDQVVVAKGVDRDRFLPLDVTQLVDVDDLHLLAAKE